jgi:YspA, cpYpsA-related SLOG family
MLSLRCCYLDMRIVVTGERAWACDELAMVVLQRLIARYGPDIVIVHGGAVGVDEAFNKACKSLGIAVEVRLAEWPQTGTPTISTRNRELIKPGADLCIALHRSVRTSERTRDCVLQAIQAGIPTFLIEDEQASPIRLHRADTRLARSV